jgi:hypothetical protein
VLPKNNIVVACSPKVEPLAMRDRGAEAPNGLEA